MKLLWLGDCSKFMLFNFSGLCPGCPAFYGNRAACHMMLGQFVQALEDARTSVQFDPNFVKGYVRVAKCCVALGELHAARQVNFSFHINNDFIRCFHQFVFTIFFHEFFSVWAAEKENFLLVHIYQFGTFTNYVDKILAFFDHLPICVDIFYSKYERWQKVDIFGLPTYLHLT